MVSIFLPVRRLAGGIHQNTDLVLCLLNGYPSPLGLHNLAKSNTKDHWWP